LATALSVSTKQAYDAAYEDKGRMEEGFGALLLAMHGRPHCPALARILERAGWDGGNFTRVLRRRIIRHVSICRTCDNCGICIDRQPRLVDRYRPVLIPILLAPELNEKIRETIRRVLDEEDEEDRKKKPAAVTPVEQGEKKKSDWIDVVGNIFAATFLISLVATVGPKLFPDLFDKSGGGTVALNVWTPSDLGNTTTGRVQVWSQPAGMNCMMRTETDPCHAQFTFGTQVTLTAVISPALTQSGRQLVWVGCGSGASAAQPCTVALTADTSVCVAPVEAAWTVEECRARAGG
jgi:hypothetical protein